MRPLAPVRMMPRQTIVLVFGQTSVGVCGRSLLGARESPKLWDDRHGLGDACSGVWKLFVDPRLDLFSCAQTIRAERTTESKNVVRALFGHVNEPETVG